MSWCSFSVCSFLFIFCTVWSKSISVLIYTSIFLHVSSRFQEPVTHRDTSHVPHFQDLASTWEHIRAALHQLFPPLPSPCVFIFCLFSCLMAKMLCYALSLFIPLSLKSKAFIVVLTFFERVYPCFEQVMSFLLCFEVIIFFVKVICSSYTMATNPAFESCILMSQV